MASGRHFQKFSLLLCASNPGHFLMAAASGFSHQETTSFMSFSTSQWVAASPVGNCGRPTWVETSGLPSVVASDWSTSVETSGLPSVVASDWSTWVETTVLPSSWVGIAGLRAVVVEASSSDCFSSSAAGLEGDVGFRALAAPCT